MTTQGNDWIKPFISNLKNMVIFTMMVIAIAKSNLVGFVLYFVMYQIASMLRVVIYGIVFQEKSTDNVLLITGYDYLDIASLITQNRIPKVSYFPLYTMAFTLAFVLFTVWSQPLTYPQMGITVILGLCIVMYLLTIYMSISAYVFIPYLELIFGYCMGTLSTYIIGKAYPAGLLFTSGEQPRRKRLICKVREKK